MYIPSYHHGQIHMLDGNNCKTVTAVWEIPGNDRWEESIDLLIPI